MRLVGDFLAIRYGKKAWVSATNAVKLMLISSLNLAKSSFSGWEKSQRCWVPALRKMQSTSGDAFMILDQSQGGSQRL